MKPANYRDDAVFILGEILRQETFDGAGWTDDELESSLNNSGYFWVEPDHVWCKDGRRKTFDFERGMSVYCDARQELAERRRRREAKLLCRWNEAAQGWKAVTP